MKKIITYSLILAFSLLLVFFMPKPTLAMTGNGTAEDPFVCYNVTDLQNISNNLTAYYELANDIDASGTSTWNGGAGFVPIGQNSPYFTGTFDGAGYTISGLFINRSAEENVGLFGQARTTAVIQDVRLTDVDITGKESVGALAGFTRLATISDCSSTGTVNGNGCVGGLVGWFQGYTTTQAEIEDCYSTCDIVTIEGDWDPYYIGGLIGSVNIATITSCSATGNITDEIVGTENEGMGGFIGNACQGTINISTCYATGNVVTTSGTWLGGLVGRSYYSGTVLTISNCYVRGAVDASGNADGIAGGLIGYMSVFGTGANITVENCYSTGAVTQGENVGEGGGLIGSQDTATITRSYWDTQTSGTEYSDGGIGRPTVEMKCKTFYLNADWDFDTIWTIDSDYNDGYPCFLWQYFWLGTFNQVIWFQPNAIIEGTELPNRTGEVDGIITWGANPAGITITHDVLVPEEEYEFMPVIPEGQDIIQPNPDTMVGDIDLEALRDNPLYPLVQILSIDGFLNERLVWIGLAWLIVIISMIGVHLGFDTRKNTNKPQHFVLTTITGLGLTIMFYTMGIFPLWTIILMSFGLVGAIIWERQPVI